MDSEVDDMWAVKTEKTTQSVGVVGEDHGSFM